MKLPVLNFFFFFFLFGKVGGCPVLQNGFWVFLSWWFCLFNIFFLFWTVPSEDYFFVFDQKC